MRGPRTLRRNAHHPRWRKHPSRRGNNVSNIFLPRIKPELIELGDTISVVHKRNQGVVSILEGIVHERRDSGNVRYLLTAEGATLLAWTPGRTDVTVRLINRPAKPQPTLAYFDNNVIDETIRERIA